MTFNLQTAMLTPDVREVQFAIVDGQRPSRPYGRRPLRKVL